MKTINKVITKDILVTFLYVFVGTIGVSVYFLLSGNNNYSLPNIKNSSLDSLSCQEAYRLTSTNKSNLIFVDARNEVFYNSEHISSAICVPFELVQNSESIDDFIKLDKNKTIIVYCDLKICSLSKYLSHKFKESGFSEVYYLSGGLDRWKKLGYAVSGNAH